jgi:uncharacterized spore protein YtfJ
MTEAPSDTGALDRFREIVDNATAGRVFGAPIAHDDMIILPVVKISTGAGGGRGTRPAKGGRQADGTGGGFGMSVRPLGVYVLRDGKVSWQPAIDVNTVILGGQLVAVTALLVLRALLGTKASRHARLRQTMRVHRPRRR